MKIWLFLMLLLPGFSLTMCACSSNETPAESKNPATTPDPQPGNSRCLIVYFSCTNTTKGIAERIADVTNGKCHRIMPGTGYTAGDLDYNNPSSRANREQDDASARPAIIGKIDEITDYDTIFLGYPVWWGKAPKIVFTFLESYDFSGKTIIPFCTSGSSGIGSSDTDLHTSAPKAQWKAGKRFSAGSTKKDITNWIESLQLNK